MTDTAVKCVTEFLEKYDLLKNKSDSKSVTKQEWLNLLLFMLYIWKVNFTHTFKGTVVQDYFTIYLALLIYTLEYGTVYEPLTTKK